MNETIKPPIKQKTINNGLGEATPNGGWGKKMNDEQKKPSKTETLRVCIIDDDENLIKTVERFFLINGKQVLSLTSVIGCSKKINAFNPHVILLDVEMPSLKGDKLIEVLRKTLTRMPKIILFSGIHPEALNELAGATGADGFFSKTESFSKLITMINKLTFDNNFDNLG